MTAQLWKRAGADAARVSFRCPWCDVTSTADVCGRHGDGRAVWLLVACQYAPCARGVLIRAPVRGPWRDADTGEAGLLLDTGCVHPRGDAAPERGGAMRRCAAVAVAGALLAAAVAVAITTLVS